MRDGQWPIVAQWPRVFSGKTFHCRMAREGLSTQGRERLSRPGTRVRKADQRPPWNTGLRAIHAKMVAFPLHLTPSRR